MDWSIQRVKRFDQELLAVLESLETEAFGEGGLNPWLMVPLIRHGAVFVMRSSTGTVGAAAEYMRDLDEPSLSYLVGISVEKSLRGQGLGKRLLVESLQWLQKQKFKTVELTVDPQNAHAVGLYRKIGFSYREIKADEYGPGEDRLFMVLDLTNFEEEMHG